MLLAILGLAVAGAAYFTVSWLTSSFTRRRATIIQRANATIAESQKRDRRVSLFKKLGVQAGKRGWKGSVTPLLIGAVFFYVACVLILNGLGMGSVVSFLVALPLCGALSWGVVRNLDERRQRAFRRQLLTALSMLASQIESGNSPQRALAMVSTQVESPLAEELEQVLADATTTKDLIAPLRELYERYPVRALSVLITAFEIDQQMGSKLSSVLHSASEALGKEFELVEEMRAEISQTRSEFYIVAGIILFICVYMIALSGALVGGAFTTPGGIIVLTLAGANFALGVWRVSRILARTRGRV
jgi:tight adherence protein B